MAGRNGPSGSTSTDGAKVPSEARDGQNLREEAFDGRRAPGHRGVQDVETRIAEPRRRPRPFSKRTTPESEVCSRASRALGRSEERGASGGKAT